MTRHRITCVNSIMANAIHGNDNSDATFIFVRGVLHGTRSTSRAGCKCKTKTINTSDWCRCDGNRRRPLPRWCTMITASYDLISIACSQLITRVDWDQNNTRCLDHMKEIGRQQNLRTAETGRSVGIGLVMCGASGRRGARELKPGRYIGIGFQKLSFPSRF